MEVKKQAPKVEAIYQAVADLFAKGADLNNLTVAEITAQAQIGKGTAYEYFANKEEMIAGALYYKTQEVCVWLYDRVRRAESLYERMQTLFDCMDEQFLEVNCLCRVLHVMMDNSAVSRKLKEIVEREMERGFGVIGMIRQMVLDENEESQKLDTDKESFLTLEICSKIVCYIIYLGDESSVLGISREKMRKMLCEDICRQVAYLRAGA